MYIPAVLFLAFAGILFYCVAIGVRFMDSAAAVELLDLYDRHETMSRGNSRQVELEVKYRINANNFKELHQAPLRKSTDTLDNNERLAVERRLNQLNEPNNTYSAPIKTLFDSLKSHYERYSNLLNRLARVHDFLSKNNASDIDDEIITMSDVKTPILLVKLYQQGKNWRVVPANSYITDKDILLRWLEKKPKHPLNQEYLLNPGLYNKKPTRYVWHELTAADCFSQELGELTAIIRELSKALNTQLSAVNKTGYGWNNFSRLLFWQVRLPENNSVQQNTNDTPLNTSEGYVEQINSV